MIPNLNPSEPAVDNPSDAFVLGALFGWATLISIQAIYHVVRDEVEAVARSQRKHRAHRRKL